MNRKWVFSLIYFTCTLLAILLFHSYLSSEHNEVIAYSDFKRLAHERKLLDVVVDDRTVTADVDLRGAELTTTSPDGTTRVYRGPGHRKFVTFRVDDPTLIAELQSDGVRYSAVPRSHWLDELLSILVPTLISLAIWFWAVRRLGS